MLLYDHDECLLLDLNGAGEELWRTEAIIAEGVRAHADLPGYFLTFHGDIEWLTTDGCEVAKEGFKTPEVRYVREAEVYPAPDGTPRFLVAGSRLDDWQGVEVSNLSAESVWDARFHSDVAGLAMLEPAGGPRCFAVTTRNGDLLLFDEDGRLLHHRTLPQPPSSDIGVAVYSIDAGPFDDGSWGLAIEFLEWTVLYRLNDVALEELRK
jgi:hypothetical protein